MVGVCHRYERNAVFCGELLRLIGGLPPGELAETVLRVEPRRAAGFHRERHRNIACRRARAEPGNVLRQTQQPVRRDAPAFGKENTVGQKRGIVRRKPRRAAERNGKIAQRGGLDKTAGRQVPVLYHF